jgi:uncharacterized membrane protein YqiK
MTDVCGEIGCLNGVTAFNIFVIVVCIVVIGVVIWWMSFPCGDRR